MSSLTATFPRLFEKTGKVSFLFFLYILSTYKEWNFASLNKRPK